MTTRWFTRGVLPLTGLCALCNLALAQMLPLQGSWSELLDAHRAQHPQTIAQPLPRALLLSPARDKAVQLAPTGGITAILRADGERRSVLLLAADQREPRLLLPQTDADALHWSMDGQWLFLEGPQRISALRLADGHTASSQDKTMFNAIEVLGADPSQPAALLVRVQVGRAGSTPGPRYQLLRLAAQHGTQVLHESAAPFIAFVVDRAGLPRYRWRVDGAQYLIEALQPPGSGDAHTTEVLRCTELRRCLPASLLAGASGEAWLNSDLASDRRGLLRMDPRGQLERVGQDPRGEADLHTVVLEQARQQPRLLQYRSTLSHTQVVDPADQKALDRLQSQLPGVDVHIQIGRFDEPWLVAAQGSDQPQPRWYRYTPKLNGLELLQIELRSPGADSERTAGHYTRRWPVRWTASDGMVLHGFLSLPAQADPRAAPLVVHVHGGPWSSSTPEYSVTAQLLSSRGYMVFEPNFRGSTGFGRAYVFSARGDFGQGRVQQDIDEGVSQLLEAGMGDPQRIAIMGASFGGYSALLAVTYQPQRYRAAIAAVPPADLGWTLRWAAARSVHERSAAISLAHSLPLLDLDPRDAARMQRLRQQGPLAQASRLQHPVLLLAGGADTSVPIRSVTHYTAALQRGGGDVSLYLDPAAGHGLEGPDNREIYLYLTELLLAQTLQGPPPQPLDASLQALLSQRLRVQGASLRDH